MARSGSRFTKPKKANIKGNAVGTERLGGLPPHRDIVRAGQFYYQREGKRKTTIVVSSVSADGYVNAIRAVDQERVKMSPWPILATGPDGLGRHWIFQGHKPWIRPNDVHERDIRDDGYRRSSAYQSMLVVAAGIDDGGDITLRAPEIHPNLTFTVPAHLVDEQFHAQGTWISAKMDLGTINPGRLRGTTTLLGLATDLERQRGEFFLSGGVANRPDYAHPKISVYVPVPVAA